MSGRIEDCRATIHGFRVQSYGKPLSSGFKRALKRLSERGFDEPTCVVVKTSSGSPGGITHAGGRYVHQHNPHSREVIREMQARGMDPPRPPFALAPGEFTLYHEWGHRFRDAIKSLSVGSYLPLAIKSSTGFVGGELEFGHHAVRLRV